MRPTPLILGLLVLAVAWLGPLPARVPSSFAAHMTLHVAVVAVAAPLLALGLAGTRLDPTRRAGGPLSGPLAPVPLSLLELVVVWGWHAPGPHHAARASGAVLALEQASFLAVALLLWTASVPGAGEPGPGEPGAGDRPAAGVFGLLFTSMHMTLLGALLALAVRPLYHGAGVGGVDDQQAGGAVMLLVGAASYLAGGLWLTARLLRGPGDGEKGCGRPAAAPARAPAAAAARPASRQPRRSGGAIASPESAASRIGEPTP